MFKNIKIYERNGLLYFDLLVNESLIKAFKQEQKELKEKVQSVDLESVLSQLALSKNYQRLRFSSGLKSEAKGFLEKNQKHLILLYLQGNKDFKKFFECGVANELSMDYFVNLLLKRSSGLKKSSQKNIKFSSSNILFFFKNRNIKSIGTNDILEFYEFLENKNLSKNTIKIYINTLKRIFNVALDCEVLEKNPVFNKKYSKSLNTEKEIEPFSENEFFTLLKQKGDIGLYLKIALLCGARTGEILALKWNDFVLQSKKIRINKAISFANEGLHSPKTLSSNRTIDLLPTLANFIQEAKEQRGAKDEDFIFANAKGEPFLKFQACYLNKEYKSLLQSLGIKYRKIYNTRHSFASLMLSKNEPLLWVCKMLGHKNANITLQTYAKYTPTKNHNYGAFIDEALKKRQGEVL